MRTAAILTLLAAVPALAPAQGGDEAKKLFEAMEERLMKAKSVSLGFSIKGEVDAKEIVATKGSLILTQGDRARFIAAWNAEGKELKAMLCSDGKRARATHWIAQEAIKNKEVPTPKNLGAMLTRTLSRSGLYLGIKTLEIGDALKIELKPDKLFPILNLKLGGKEKVEGRETRVLSYKYQNFEVTLWVDPLTHLPLKRVLTARKKDAEVRLIELYTGIKTDAKLDAKQFELPK